MSVQAFECPECGHMNVGNIRCYNCRNPLNKKGDPYEVPQAPPSVVSVCFQKSVLTDLRNAIKAEVFKYEKRISLAEAIGILDIVKHELIEGHRE